MRIELNIEDDGGREFSITLSHNTMMPLKRSTNAVLAMVKELLDDPTFLRYRSPENS